MKYSIVIPTYNHCNDLLIPCVDSIFKNTNMTDVELIISANGCTDNTKSYLESLQQKFKSIGFENHLKIFWDNNPLGYSKACNAGIRLASSEKIILLNNDTIILDYLPKSEWLYLLELPFINDSSCGLSGPTKRYCEHIEREAIIFYCVMISRKVFDTIGLLNEEYGTGSGEDTEFCIEAEHNGFTIHACDNQSWSFEMNMNTGFFPIYHPGERTVHDTSLVSNWKEVFIRNSLILEKKYKPSWKIKKTNNSKKIGVITSVYNGIDHIISCINSVKSQTIDNIIHYVYNDGSTDNIETVLDVLTDDVTMKIYSCDNNNGLSYGRNFLLTEAINDNCEIIAFLDVDDKWDPTHLEDSIKYLNDCDIVYSYPNIINTNGEKIFPTWNIPKSFDGTYLKTSNFIWVSTVVAKANCFNNHKFNKLLDCYEDWNMWISLYEDNYLFYDKETTTATYVFNKNTNWGNPQIKYNNMIQQSYITQMDNIKNSLTWLQQNPESITLYKEVITDNCYDVSFEKIKNRCVIDVGANMGIFSIFAAALGAKKVFAVEPVSSTFNILEKNIKHSQFNNIYLLKNVVLDVANKTVNISLCNETGHNSLYNIMNSYETTTSITITDLLKLCDSDVFLKLDCEGSEYDIIMNSTKEQLEKVKEIGLEIHWDFHPVYKGIDIIRNKLVSLGFNQQNVKQIGMWYNEVFDPLPLSIEIWSK